MLCIKHKQIWIAWMTAEENNSEQQNKNWGGGGADQNTQGS